MSARRTWSFAETAEYELSYLEDLCEEQGVTGSPMVTVLAHGMAAITSALLSLGQQLPSPPAPSGTPRRERGVTS